MSKYDSQLQAVKGVLTSSQNILVALPVNCGVDCLASGLALYLALKNSGKVVSIVSESTLKVSDTNLFGVGSIQNTLTGNGTGTWVLSIGGALGSDGKPIFEKVDYDMSGSDLKLKFPIVSGQRFEPTHITPSFEGGNYELIFVVGAANLESLGNLTAQNQEVFAKAHLVNIDNSQANNQFGETKVVDPQAATLSEMVGLVISDLGLTLDADTASNLLTGIYQATNSLQGQTTPETFEVLANSFRAGGTRSVTASVSEAVPQPVSEIASSPSVPRNDVGGGFDLNQMYAPSTTPQVPLADPFTVPPVAPAQVEVSDTSPFPEMSTPQDMSSHTHEREPGTETTYSGSEVEEVVEPEEDWLTPKVYSGKSIG